MVVNKSVVRYPPFTDATFGLTEPSCVVREEQQVMSVCIEQKSPENDCGVKFEFNLTISTESGSAGIQP